MEMILLRSSEYLSTYYVVLKRNNKQVSFEDDKDSKKFIETLQPLMAFLMGGNFSVCPAWATTWR
jgi:hypothetical protein